MSNTFKITARYLGYVLICFGVSVIFYWQLGYLPEGENSTKLNTGLCFLLMGVQLILLSNDSKIENIRILIPSIVVIIIGLISFIENVTFLDFGSDNLFLLQNRGEFHLMSSATAVCFVLLAVSCFGQINSDRVSNYIFLTLKFISFTIVLTSIISYVFAFSVDSRPEFWSTMSPLTTFLFVLLIVGIIMANNHSDFLKILLGNDLGGVIARRLIIFIIPISLAFGFFVFYAFEQGDLSSEFRFVSLITLGVVLALFATLYISNHVGKLDRQRISMNSKLNLLVAEKEQLLLELHHRIKNNLQLMSSLIYIQSSKLKDQNLIKFLEEFNGRIQVALMIHESLLQNEISAVLNVNEYLNSFTDQLVTYFRKTKQNLSLELDIEDSEINPDLAFNIGIILNEAILSIYNDEVLNQNQLYISLKKSGSRFILVLTTTISNNDEEMIKHFRESSRINNLDEFVQLFGGELERSVHSDLDLKITINAA